MNITRILTLAIAIITTTGSFADVKLDGLTKVTNTEELTAGKFTIMYGTDNEESRYIYVISDWTTDGTLSMSANSIRKDTETTIDRETIINGTTPSGMTYGMLEFEQTDSGWYIKEARYGQYIGYKNRLRGFTEKDTEACLWQIGMTTDGKIRICKKLNDTDFILKIKVNGNSGTLDIYADNEKNKSIPLPDIFRIEDLSGIKTVHNPTNGNGKEYLLNGINVTGKKHNNQIIIRNGKKIFKGKH